MKFPHLAAAAVSAIVALGPTMNHALAGDLGGAPVPLRLADRPDERPRIAIVIDDLGLDWARFRSVNNLPVPVTLGFLPYGSEAQAMLDGADPRHEAILHLPMEPHRRKEDAGPDMVRTGPAEDVRAGLHANLGKLSGYRGVNNHTGSKLTADAGAMEVILRELRARDLYFLDSRTTEAAKAKRLSRRTGASVLEADLFLDGNFGRGGAAHVRRQLRLAERIAERDGSVIAIGHPYPATIETLGAWAAEKGQRFRFVTTAELLAESAAQPGES